MFRAFSQFLLSVKFNIGSSVQTQKQGWFHIRCERLGWSNGNARWCESNEKLDEAFIS